MSESTGQELPARGDDFVLLVWRDDGERKYAGELLHSAAHGFVERDVPARTAFGTSRALLFYKQKWASVVFDDAQKITVFEWTETYDDFLRELSLRVTGKVNRSDIFRMITVMYGIEHNFLRFKTIERLQFEPLPHAAIARQP